MKSKIFCIVLMVLTFISIPVNKCYAKDIDVSAKAAVLIEAKTGKIIFEKNAYQKLPMASTTKIMTTLLCLESGNLDEKFVVDPEAIKVEGSSMGLQEGDIVTKRALCIGMLLPSGNDAANVTAVLLGGSVEKFAQMMNERAAKIGMTRTCFVTPSGLEAEGHGSSAYDMSLLAREALRNKDFASICSQTSMKLSFGNPPFDRWLKNTNKLLTMYKGVNGVKTGFTDEAGRCLVSSCEKNGVSLICVTLNAPSDWSDHSKLYDYGYSTLKAVEVKPEKYSVDVVGGIGQSLPLCSDDTISIGTDNGDLSMLEERPYIENFLYAPVAKGTYAGYVDYYYEDRFVDRIEVYTDAETQIYRSHEKQDISIADKIKNFFGKIF